MLFIAVAVSALSLEAQTVYVPNGTGGIGTSSNGNVGIGTTNPKAMLDLKANSLSELSGTDRDFIGSNLVLTGTDAGRAVGKGSSLTFAFPANTDGSNIWEQARILATPDNGNSYNACGRLYLQVRDSYNPGVGGTWNWRTGLMIQANGNVGIGTTSPAKTLDVAGSIYLFSGKNGDPTLKFNNQGWARIGGSSSSGLAIWGTGNAETDDNPTMFVTSGSVGIGTTVPDQKLTVKGKIHAEEVIVDLNVPLADYVFARDYELMPLHQVEQYVQENSRLPEMPSAAEVKQKGMGMGEMQNKMLQKIEELTLYVIQQDKRIKALEEENQRLKEK